MSLEPAVKRAPVMKDVAKLAGVSYQTVSRVLNGHPNVSASARERVEAAIAALGYRRNPVARSLVTRRSQTVGVLASELGQYGPSHTLLGLEQAARDAGYFVSIASLREVTTPAVQDILGRFADQAVDGIIVIGPHPGLLEALDAIEHSFPVVAATSDPDRPAGAGVDQRLGARLAVRHLVELGHTRIGHLSGPSDWYDAAERVEGWREAMAEAGLAAEVLIEGDWTARRGYEVGLEIAASRPATAMFVANDQMALGLLRGVQESGLAVPRDLSIVGYDDQPEAAYFFPPLTTVRQDFEALGRRCIEALLAAFDEDHAPARSVEPQLVVRSTTAAPPQVVAR
ncbi:LacI family DNA-binding transcriptional regulator [Sinomonas mesophila]|uniref:LacI family DNA-binding transcriptional regulator n=1 Tax=Sinomonas mesophila TaxID=1531955 RepID=UPI001FEAF04A|nr:LacI family DNA-binding transcriptional regulator [Sinomonas mesophila]